MWMTVHSHLIDSFNTMLDELNTYYLEVCLVPSKYYEYAIRGAKIRAVINCNPDWYRKLCEKYQSSRIRKNSKSDTRIKRRNIIKLLERLAKNKTTTSYYLNDLLMVAESIYDNSEPPF